MIVVREFLS